MIPDWSERSADDAAYPGRHWESPDPECCLECEDPLTTYEAELNNGICDTCIDKIREEMECDETE